MRWLIALLVLPVLTGCGFFNTPPGKVIECSAASAAEVLTTLCPMPFTSLCTDMANAAFTQACTFASKQPGATQESATKAGIDAAKMQLEMMKKAGHKL